MKYNKLLFLVFFKYVQYLNCHDVFFKNFNIKAQENTDHKNSEQLF